MTGFEPRSRGSKAARLIPLHQPIIICAAAKAAVKAVLKMDVEYDAFPSEIDVADRQMHSPGPRRSDRRLDLEDPTYRDRVMARTKALTDTQNSDDVSIED